MGWAVAPQADNRSSISMTATTATDETSSVSYYFTCVSGGSGCTDSGWQTSTSFVADGLSSNSTYSFQVKARDEAANETAVSETLSATTQANLVPVAIDDTGAVDNASSVTIDVLVNDSDADGDTLTIVSATQGGNGSVVYLAGNITYTPNAGFVGTDSFTYTISDGEETAMATVTVDVTGTPIENTAPVAVNDTGSVDNASSITINVLENDSDADGDALTVSNVGQGNNGSVVYTASSVTYTPNADFVGSDSFVYTITDGTDTATATVSITVTGSSIENNDPVAVNDSASVNSGSSVTIAVLDNDSDSDGDVLAIESTTQGRRGTVSIEGNQVVYTPNRKQGRDSFNYTISDGNGGMATASVSIRIKRASFRNHWNSWSNFRSYWRSFFWR